MIGFENNQPVPIVFPDVEAMDSFAEWLADEMRKGMSYLDAAKIAEARSDARTKRDITEEKWEAIAAVLLLIIDDPKPRLASRLLMWASGMLTEGNLTLPDIAQKHGIRKQAAQQKGERLREKLNLPLTSFMRSVEAREAMRKANFRKPKTK